ncbi:MAG: eL32 family ribosomal protein [Candidatus Woesearchaeota archaeon]
MDKKLLDFKNKKKSKNPKFIRQDAYKKKRITLGWRKPRGWDSKQRKRMQRQAIVEPGYGSPKELRGVHKSGLKIVYVSNLEDIKKINPKEEGVILSKVGLKKKLMLIEELIKNNITILNIKEPQKYLELKKKQLEDKKKKSEEKKEKTKETKPESKKESIEEKLSDEERKKLEKEEIDRLLTKKF